MLSKDMSESMILSEVAACSRSTTLDAESQQGIEFTGQTSAPDGGSVDQSAAKASGGAGSY